MEVSFYTRDEISCKDNEIFFKQSDNVSTRFIYIEIINKFYLYRNFRKKNK